ncbi:MAG TPA: hypothetical protein VFI49_13985, partial [Rudaea sp.]|nr:hypothetical protein [Rudaea sp.]
MNNPADGRETPTVDASRWRRTLSRYRTPNAARSVFELAVTALPFMLAWFTMYWALAHGHVWL